MPEGEKLITYFFLEENIFSNHSDFLLHVSCISSVHFFPNNTVLNIYIVLLQLTIFDICLKMFSLYVYTHTCIYFYVFEMHTQRILFSGRISLPFSLSLKLYWLVLIINFNVKVRICLSKI